MNFLFYFLSILSLGSPALAGTSTGNGGQAIFCLDQKEVQPAAMAFDLFEGALLFQYRYREANPDLPPLDIALEALKRLSSQDFAAVSAKAREVTRRIQASESLRRQTMPLTPDISPVLLPAGCNLLQTLVFRPSGQIETNALVWQALPPLSQAALILHESIYWELRDRYGDQSSRRTRRIVAWLLAEDAVGTLESLDIDARPIECSSDQSDERVLLVAGPGGTLGVGLRSGDREWETSPWDTFQHIFPAGNFPSTGKTKIRLRFPRHGAREMRIDWRELWLFLLDEQGKSVRLDCHFAPNS